MSAGEILTAACGISIGDELLNGRTVDSNSGLIQRAFARHRIRFLTTRVVPDEGEAIAAALEATDPGRLVVLTGGLGSTPDDLTREAVAAWAGVRLEADSGLEAMLRRRAAERGFACTPTLLKQALVPRGLVPLPNPAGSAPGLIGWLCNRIVLLMPGIPAEVNAVLEGAMRWLRDEELLASASPTLRLRTAQRSEVQLARQCVEAGAGFGNLRWSWWLSEWGVDIQVGTDDPQDAPGALPTIRGRLLEAFGGAVYAEDERSLPRVVQDLMIDRRLHLAVAESCTGGLIGSCLTEVAGSSEYFLGGMLTYADEVKTSLLGVDEALLAGHGAVSAEVAAAMAAGCRERLGADLALAVTGIAGPGGGTEEKPVGTTWIGVAGPEGVLTRHYRFPADRYRNRRLTAAAALDTLRRILVLDDGGEAAAAGDAWSLR